MNTSILVMLAAEPWAITSAALQDIMARAGELSPDMFASADDEQVAGYYAVGSRSGSRTGTVAVVSVYGMLTKRDSLFSMLMGGTSYTRLSAQIRQLAADDTVAAIMLNIDSPGGQGQGVGELAAEVRRARESKPVIALANALMASAAAWIGWSADEVIATPDAIVGSQGAFALHIDTSKALEMEGVKPTYIASSGAKAGGRPGLPLDDDTQAEMQAIVDENNRLFVADVAAGRGLTPAQVKDQYGNGAVFSARDAKKRGMVDRIATYPETLARLSGVKPAGVRAEADFPEIEAIADELVPDLPESALADGPSLLPATAASARFRFDSDYRFTHR